MSGLSDWLSSLSLQTPSGETPGLSVVLGLQTWESIKAPMIRVLEDEVWREDRGVGIYASVAWSQARPWSFAFPSASQISLPLT